MTSTIHHPVAVPSRGLIICEMEEESNEPKTILEIGGVARPRPTYIIPPPPRPPAMPATIGNQPYLGHWKAQHDVVPSPYPAYTEFQEQKIVRLSNANWSGVLDKLPPGSLTSKGIFLSRLLLSREINAERGVPHFIIMSLNLNADFPENYSPRALKNPHIASSLQQTIYGKNDSSVDSNGNSAHFRYDSFELRLIIFGKQF